MKRILGIALAAVFATSCGALKGGTIGGGSGLPSPLPAAGVAFDLVACRNAVADNYCDGPARATFTITPLGRTDSPRVQIGDGDGYVFVPAIPSTWTLVSIAIEAPGYMPFTINSQTADLVAENAAGRHNFFGLKSAIPPMPPPPTRAEILNLHITFQGLYCDTQQFGRLPWFEAALPWLTPADRSSCYAAKRASTAWGPGGDTHALIFLPSGPPLYDEPNQPYSADRFGPLDWTAGGTKIDGRLADMIAEVARAGFNKVLLFEGGDDGERGFPIAMLQLDLVHDALISTPYGDLRQNVIPFPGFDGVFYGYTPEHVAEWGAKCRRLFFYCGIEHQPGRIPVGEGGSDYLPGGKMTTFDLILAEFDGPNLSDWRTKRSVDGQGRPDYPGNQIWQIGGRMLGPFYKRPSDQPADSDSSSPPFYLSPGSSRGPFVHCAFEWVGLYNFVRGWETADDEQRSRDYFKSAGWTCGG